MHNYSVSQKITCYSLHLFSHVFYCAGYSKYMKSCKKGIEYCKDVLVVFWVTVVSISFSLSLYAKHQEDWCLLQHIKCIPLIIFFSLLTETFTRLQKSAFNQHSGRSLEVNVLCKILLSPPTMCYIAESFEKCPIEHNQDPETKGSSCFDARLTAAGAL